MLHKLLQLLTGSKGYKTVEDALWDLVVRTNGELHKKEVFVIRDDTGHYFADIKKPSKGSIISSFASPF